MHIFVELRLPYGLSSIFSFGLKMFVVKEMINHRRQDVTDTIISHRVKHLFSPALGTHNARGTQQTKMMTDQ